MASVSFSVELTVSERLDKYCKNINSKRDPKRILDSRTKGIDDLLKKAGF